MGYIGNIGDKVEIEVTIKGIYTFTTQFGWEYKTNYIYNMEDADGNVLVWKTQKNLGIELSHEIAEKVGYAFKGQTEWHYEFHGKNWKEEPRFKIHEVSKGDIITIKGTVKAHDTYKGTEQTVLTRCKVTGVTFFALTKEEWMEQKREEQFHSLEEGDFVWKMPYRQYKEAYADCETIVGSCNNDNPQRICTIEVIIRNGRLKASGVRGEHFHGFDFSFDFEGKKTSSVFRAVSEENARKQLAKAFKGAENIELERVW